MTKQERIQEAYGESWESLKESIDLNGWCKNELVQDDDGNIVKCPSCKHVFNESDTKYCINSLERCPKCNGHVGQYEYHFRFVEASEGVQKRFGEWRPKSLQGIEDNNGWIKIESEEDLPKDDIDCFYIIEVPSHYSNAGTVINIGRFNFKKNIMSQQEKYFTMDNFFYHRPPFVTHYKPIERPKPPIY